AAIVARAGSSCQLVPAPPRVGNDLIPVGDLTLGGEIGPDGSPASATRFSETAHAALPCFAGLNVPRFTVSLKVPRPAWSVPVEQWEYLVSRDEVYEILLVENDLGGGGVPARRRRDGAGHAAGAALSPVDSRVVHDERARPRVASHHAHAGRRARSALGRLDE